MIAHDASLQFLASCAPSGQSISALLATLPDAQPRIIGCPLRAVLPVSKFTLRRCQRSPDREVRRSNRRMLGADGTMPSGMRTHYTEGERAVLRIIAGEYKRHGYCDLHVDEIARRAGVSRTTVQNALREAKRLGHIWKKERRIPGRKSHTNIIRVISREWLEWLKKSPGITVGHKTFSTFNFVNPTKRKIFNRETTAPVEKQHGIRREYG
jgi:hypothetical protein